MKIKLLILFILLNGVANSQNNTEMALYNVGLGSFVGGVGAVINKNSGEKTGKVFLKGFLQGAVGGYVVYESKKFMLKVTQEEQIEYAWGSKLINSVGISVVENASLNKNLWENWHINIGFNRMDLNFENNIKFKYRIMPVSLLLTGYFAYGNKFEFDLFLKTGETIFSTSKDNSGNAGATWGTVIIIEDDKINDKRVVSHEIIHSFQYNDFNFVNTFLERGKNNIIANSTFLTKYQHIFYFDLQAPVFGALYLLESSKKGCYYNNFFEKEAGNFSNTITCD
ncbi:MAG: hypothetical protein ACSHXF_06315 [Aquaticitalea sp.]